MKSKFFCGNLIFSRKFIGTGISRFKTLNRRKSLVTHAHSSDSEGTRQVKFSNQPKFNQCKESYRSSPRTVGFYICVASADAKYRDKPTHPKTLMENQQPVRCVQSDEQNKSKE